ncbi:MAG: copper resistance protein B [Phenylobacterium sp.]|mgnify:FL=1|nr:copper resistance protein B [Phenylobacterium sp.]MBT9470791.1 copper resistance protein B [Phenylobacterium sp.]
MNRLALIGLLPLALATSVAAQTMDHSSMPGMTMPMPAAKPPAKPKAAPLKKSTKAKPDPRRLRHVNRPTAVAPRASPASTPSGPHAGHDMAGMPMPGAAADGNTMANMAGMAPAQPPRAGGNMPAMPGMKGMDMSTPAPPGHDMAAMPAMTEPDIPKTPPPPPPTDHAADRVFDPATMAAARVTLRGEHGGERISMVMANIAEYQARSGGEAGYHWVGEARYGGDINRFVLKSEGEGSRRQGVDSAEVQGLYSHAIGPYFDLQAGVRQDFKPHSRTYATVGFEGLAPYWFDVQGALFLSNKGELLGRLESTYDLRLTQRLILQPRAEVNLAAQDTPETRTGSGLSNAELGLRLRYEIRREFAPYIGVSYDRKFGRTADYARALGEDRAATSFVIGIRAWF